MSYDEKCSLQDALKKWSQEDCGLDKAVMEKFKNRKVVFFIGAGVSRLEGVMGWDDFSKELIKEAFPSLCDQEQLLQSNISSKEKISIAYEKFCNDGKKNEFYKKFGKALKPKRVSSGVYKILAKFNVNYLTTNADKLFEKVLGKEFCYTDFDKEKLFNKKHISRGQLFYLHGRFGGQSSKSKLVFTAAEYVRRYNDDAFCSFLRQLFNSDSAVFFIGYGLNEYELIDYVATKVGLQNGGNSSLVYSLEPFFSSQETLFSARRLYFNSLGIKILPYCKDNGYVELINVLKSLLNAFRSQSNVPYDDYQDIHYNINIKCTKALLAEVDKVLQENINDGRFGIACETLQKSLYWESWGSKVINDKLWFPVYDLKEYLSWEDTSYRRIYLLLFLMQQSSDCKYYQKAKSILDYVIQADNDSIKSSSPYLIALYINIISCFDNSLLKNDYFDFTDTAFKLYGRQISYVDLPKENVIVKWDNHYLKRFILSVLNGMPNVNRILFEEENYLINYLEKNQLLSDNNIVNKTFFDSFYCYAKNKIEEDKSNPLYYISNLDNVEKAHYKGWQAVLEKLIFYFVKLDYGVQKKYIEKGLRCENDTICKIWLYILRHTLKDASFLLNDSAKCFMYERCLCELYLSIRDAKVKDNSKLLEKVENSSFGMDLEFYDKNYFNSIKNSFRAILGGNVNGEPNDLVNEAERCDYVRVCEMPKENFDNVAIGDVIEKMKTSVHNYEKTNLAEVVVSKFLELQDFQLELVLEQINGLNDEAINLIILQSRMQEKQMNESQKKIITLYALKILMSERNYDLLIKNCFALLACADLNLIYNREKDLFNECWRKWKNRQISENIDISQKNNILFQVINTAEYERVSFICNYWATRRDLEKTICIDEFCECLKFDDKNVVSRWCFSFRAYYIVWIIGEDKLKELISSLVYNDNSIDYIAVLLTIYSMRTISKEFCDLITSSNILDKKDVLKMDAQLTDALYKYCASAYFYEKIQLANLRPILNNDAFWEALFVCLNAKVGKDKLFTIKKIEDELWPVLKGCIKNNNTLKNKVYRLMQSFILNNAVDENLIKILIELLSICSDIEERVYVERDKLINILRKYPAEAKDLTELMFVRGTYSSIYDTEIVSVLKYWAEVDNEFANSILGNLYKNNKIYLDPYNKLYNIINQL